MQKHQVAHLGPNAQSPPCRRLLDLHHLRNVWPRCLDPPPSCFRLNQLRQNQKQERRRFGGGNGERNYKDTSPEKS